MTDPFDALGVARDANDEQIKSAYRKLAMQWHPDQNPGNTTAEAKFKEIATAYDAIQTAEKRAALTQQTQGSPFGGFQGFNFNFNMGAGSVEDILRGWAQQHSNHNRNYSTQCEIDFVQAFEGCEVNLKIQDKDVWLKIPAGVDHGTRIRVGGGGENAYPSIPPGDLFVTVLVRSHPLWTRNGSNLFCNSPMNVIDAMLGTRVVVETLDGDTVEFDVQAGVQTGHRFRLEGRGVPVIGSTERGDMFVTIVLTTPENLSEEQIELLKKIRAL